MTILSFYELVANYAKSIKKSIMYIRVETDNPEEREELYKFYENKIPVDLYAALMANKENFIEYDYITTALREAEEFFPYSKDLLDDEKHFYVYVHVFDENGNSMLENT